MSKQILESEFKQARSLVETRITEELQKANEALQTAALLADTVGVPFDAYLTIFDQSLQYVPTSFQSKFAELDFLVTGVTPKEDEEWDPSEDEDWNDSGCSWDDSGC